MSCEFAVLLLADPSNWISHFALPVRIADSRKLTGYKILVTGLGSASSHNI
jgi:hypothetical protein